MQASIFTITCRGEGEGGRRGTNGKFTTHVDHVLLPMFTPPPLASDPERIPVLD